MKNILYFEKRDLLVVKKKSYIFLISKIVNLLGNGEGLFIKFSFFLAQEITIFSDSKKKNRHCKNCNQSTV